MFPAEAFPNWATDDSSALNNSARMPSLAAASQQKGKENYLITIVPAQSLLFFLFFCIIPLYQFAGGRRSRAQKAHKFTISLYLSRMEDTG